MKAERTNGAFLSVDRKQGLRTSLRNARTERLRQTAALLPEKKERQRRKIREFRLALDAAGCRALDTQAEALGLSRSTTWSILKANHKSSGLSASILNRMWASPKLPPHVRIKVIEYIEEKYAGLYGDSLSKCRKFRTRLCKDLIATIDLR